MTEQISRKLTSRLLENKETVMSLERRTSGRDEWRVYIDDMSVSGRKLDRHKMNIVTLLTIFTCDDDHHQYRAQWPVVLHRSL
jgi:hypothetical protein